MRELTREPLASGEAATDSIELLPPELSDAAAIWTMVRDSGALDLNSAYAYLMACRDFADTSVVAREGGVARGFVIAYVPPPRPTTLFVWQVAVSPDLRGAGLGGRMLDHLADRLGERIDHLEANVTPRNLPSRRLFCAFARRIGAPISVTLQLAKEMFPQRDHESEDLLRIGPWSRTP